MKLKMIVAICILFPASLTAQVGENTSAISTDSISQRDKSLYFFLVNQVALTYQFCASEHHAWNITADITGSFYSELHDATSQLIVRGQNVDEGTFSFSLSPQSKWYFNPSTERIQLFVAVGPTVKFSYWDQRIYSMYPREPVMTRITRTWEVGLLVSSGVEARIINWLSFVAKYDLSGTYGKSRATVVYHNTGGDYADDVRRWVWSLSQIRIGLGVHF